MTLREKDAAELFRELTARAAQGQAECLGDALLVRASTGTLSSADRERVVTHIARCSDCAREYQIARALRPLESEARAVLGRPRWMAYAAAAILVAALPLIVWLAVLRQRDAATIAQLERRLATAPLTVPAPAPPPRIETVEIDRPHIGVPIVDLDADVVRGGTNAVVVPAASDVFALILHLPEETTGAADVELKNAQGARLWQDRVTLDRAASVTLALPRRLAPPGTYSLRVGKTVFHFRVAGP